MKSGHISDIEYNNLSACVRFSYVRGKVVLQTRIGEIPYSGWVCLDRNALENVLDLDHFQSDVLIQII